MESEQFSDSVLTLIRQKESLEKVANVAIEEQDNTVAFEILDKLKERGRKDHKQKRELQKRIACAEERIKNLESLLDNKQSISSNTSAPVTIQTLPFGRQYVPTTEKYFPTDNVLQNILPLKSKSPTIPNIIRSNSVSLEGSTTSSDTLVTSSLLSSSTKLSSNDKKSSSISSTHEQPKKQTSSQPRLEICPQFSINSVFSSKSIQLQSDTCDSISTSNASIKKTNSCHFNQVGPKKNEKTHHPKQNYSENSYAESQYESEKSSSKSKIIAHDKDIVHKRLHHHTCEQCRSHSGLEESEINIGRVHSEHCLQSHRKVSEEEELIKKAKRTARTPNPCPCPCPVCVERRRREKHLTEQCRICSFEKTCDNSLADLERFRIRKFAEMDAYSKKIERTKKKSIYLTKVEMKAFKKSIHRVAKAETKMREKGVKMPESAELIDYVCRQFHQFLKANEPITFETAYKLVGRAVYHINKSKLQ